MGVTGMIGNIIDLVLFMAATYLFLGAVQLVYALIRSREWNDDFAEGMKRPSFVLLFLLYSPISFFKHINSRE